MWFKGARKRGLDGLLRRNCSRRPSWPKGGPEVRLEIPRACDLVCIDSRDGGAVVVEIKCGFDGYLDARCGHMRHECAMLADSPRQQHQVQLALTTALFARTYKLTAARAFVLRACDAGVHFYRLRPSVLNMAPAMLLRMAATRDMQNKA